jgi:argonaute-like protein implicated in RNA metabolism and viral defense
VNGQEVELQAYNINENNYFKLRDLAMVLSSTDKRFEVGWDQLNNAISIETGQTYTPVGGELIASGNARAQKVRINSSVIYMDGQKENMIAYTINGNNYFKLRDIAALLDFGVTWDAAAKAVNIDTTTSYR